ncbi:hydroxymethylglutaryl-CoA synthase family protein [Bergeyella sp. RCAD1439]|uniref:hydroxymethylglutaryl-CoA synthase family protein n=1 Tax=Bergeyella anatis TaxID=3113737 RepID=UPI002E175615|nr:hydroxymethylglutaryl-CoA synthase [Bergeyella sp. RCAD1439]
MTSFGIEAAGYYVPSLYLEIGALAEARYIDPVKLEKGLGLRRMAVADVHEDAATFAAEALLRLMEDYAVDPSDIGRVYLGTESALDAAKPTATYAVQMVEAVLAEKYGERCFKYCDALDMTFACIGAVDALQNSLDYCRANPGRKAVVIASDYAKYELGSSGEYTQGGGAVALLISDTPKLMAVDSVFGVSMESVFDFFKPRRLTAKSDWAKASPEMPDRIEVFSDEPVFDGQYSNQCYQDRIREAYGQYKQLSGQDCPFESWRYLIFHLPYAFHGKRVFTEIYAMEKGWPCATPEELKEVAKSESYRALVDSKIEPSQRASSLIGNMYTASIFMALLSALQVALDSGEALEGQKIGFLAYGSGSKSKVFSGRVGSSWREVVSKWNLFETLDKRTPIDFVTYERLHRKQMETSVNPNYKGFGLDFIEAENPVLKGARYYVRK